MTHDLSALVRSIAAVPVWRDTYPDGPDRLDGEYKVTVSDVRLCRALALSEPAVPATGGERKAIRREAFEEAIDATKDVIERNYGEINSLHRYARDAIRSVEKAIRALSPQPSEVAADSEETESRYSASRSRLEEERRMALLRASHRAARSGEHDYE